MNVVRRSMGVDVLESLEVGREHFVSCTAVCD